MRRALWLEERDSAPIAHGASSSAVSFTSSASSSSSCFLASAAFSSSALDTRKESAAASTPSSRGRQSWRSHRRHHTTRLPRRPGPPVPRQQLLHGSRPRPWSGISRCRSTSRVSTSTPLLRTSTTWALCAVVEGRGQLHGHCQPLMTVPRSKPAIAASQRQRVRSWQPLMSSAGSRVLPWLVFWLRVFFPWTGGGFSMTCSYWRGFGQCVFGNKRPHLVGWMA